MPRHSSSWQKPVSSLAKYIAYCDGKRIFCCVHLQQRGLRVWLKLHCEHLPTFARDVSNVGHWGVGDLELAITTPQEWAEAQPLIEQSFAEAPRRNLQTDI
jgi:predicted transport protein